MWIHISISVGEVNLIFGLKTSGLLQSTAHKNSEHTSLVSGSESGVEALKLLPTLSTGECTEKHSLAAAKAPRPPQSEPHCLS